MENLLAEGKMPSDRTEFPLDTPKEDEKPKEDEEPEDSESEEEDSDEEYSSSSSES